MSQDEFDQKWAAVDALDQKGPSADEVLEYLSLSYDTTVQYDLSVVERNTSGYSLEFNFSLAA
ncbi:hypothetical protein [Dyadobacter arcticus]|uniref:Uncharacterized protein n=1 Tax=Dyadobacter arcticus TaxID=1078754 RepID=A0ABX0UJS1_9BACT|nr:hypothetical protein [Dyadobacter arcticus]NIJ52334.1 hypothetical protein [Dyadobacter arcticus]